MIVKRIKLLTALKKQCAMLTAAALLASGFAAVVAPKPAHAAPVSLEADYAVPDGKLVRTEQFNNTNYTPLPVNVVDELKGIHTKVVRDFVKINWFYNTDGGYLAYSIDDPRNATNPNLVGGRQETYNFMSQFTDSILLSLTYSYSSSNPGANRLLAGETTMNWPEFDKAMKKIIYTLKQKNPKVDYIEVGNEPNLEPAYYGHTVGDIPGYMRMYQGMSEAVQWVNTQGLPGNPIKVGGPVLSGYDFTKLKQFVDLAYTNHYPVDFVSWHRYQTNITDNEKQEIEMKSYLHQFYPDAETVVSEYGWKGGGSLSDPTNNVALAKQAAFMTDSAYYFARGGTDMPMNWVAVHTLAAYFKNQFDVDYALSNGNTTDWQSFTTQDPRPLQYLNLRAWRESATTTAPMKIKEIRFFDSNNNPINIPNPSNDPSIAAVTDNDENTVFTASDYWAWLKFDLGPDAPAIARVDIKWANADINKFQLIGTPDKLHYYELLGKTFFTPYFNTMRMFSHLGDTKVQTTGGDTTLTGVRMLATQNSDTKATMMVWNDQGDGTASRAADILVKNLPAGFEGKSIRIKKYLVDETHSNYAYNKRDDLELTEESIVRSSQDLSMSVTLDKNAVMLIELEAVDPSINNIVSAGKTVTASPGITDTANLVDGDGMTAAVAADGTYPQWVQIDLGKDYDLAGTEVDWTNSLSRGYRYSIQTSSDGANYTTVADRTTDSSPPLGNSVEWFKTRARYVKLTVTDSTSSGPLSIDDIKVFAESLYKTSFETPQEQDLSSWTMVGYGSKATPWATVTDSVYQNTYVEPTLSGTTTSFAIFGSDLKDYGVEARVKVADSSYTGNVDMGILSRAYSYNSHYYFKLNRDSSGSQAILEKRINGTATTIATYSMPEPISSDKWYTLKLECVGTAITGYVDGVKVLETVDSGRANGKVGFRSHNAKADFDDLKVYPLVPQLGSILVNGVPIPGFDPKVNTYYFKAPAGTTTATVTATVYGDGDASVSPASKEVTLGGVGDEQKVTIGILNNQGNGANYYTLTLRTASADTTLSSLRLSVITDPIQFPVQSLVPTSFNLVPGQLEYTVHVPSRTKYVSIAEAVPTASNLASVQTTDAVLTDGKGTARVLVTSEAGTTAEYVIHVVANPEAPAGSVLYHEDFENGTYNQDRVTGWKSGTSDVSADLRVVDEGNGKVLEKYSTSGIAFTVGDSSTDYEVRARVKVQVSPALPGIIARASDDGKNFYMLRIHNGTNGLPGGSTGYASLGRMVNGSLKELDSKKVPYPYVVGNWYQLRLVVNGNRLQGYVDDNKVFDEVDDGTLFSGNPPALTSGKAGFRTANQASRLDDFAVMQLAADQEKPIITLNGSSTVEVQMGSVYTDEGATATDNVDGDLTASIQTVNTVNTAMPGTYTVTYQVSDSTGNMADPVVRTVVVKPAEGAPFAVALNGTLSRTGGLSVKVDLSRTANTLDHDGTEVVFFQLMKGTTPVSYVALEQNIDGTESAAAHFDVADPQDSSYQINVFVVDQLDLSGSALPLPLSNKLTIQ